ncbi:leucine-rich repeat domain-containing protein [Paenibacillus pinihumi]|uniref:leucine-rich repeat domain-containing protein n=1 Tax=Paenibacillus pinihumi TaxID=669462 RepID=UPI0004134F9C|nr:leucine-rich repeat domain-containing protein [Paenibacillus pinihumi]
MDITNHFKDQAFKAYILDKYCGNREYIFASDVNQIKSLQLAGCKLSSLEGIEYFTALQELDCSNNHLTELDISNNTSLSLINCSGNKLTALETENNPRLENLRSGSDGQYKAGDAGLRI